MRRKIWHTNTILLKPILSQYFLWAAWQFFYPVGKCLLVGYLILQRNHKNKGLLSCVEYLHKLQPSLYKLIQIPEELVLYTYNIYIYISIVGSWVESKKIHGASLLSTWPHKVSTLISFTHDTLQNQKTLVHEKMTSKQLRTIYQINTKWLTAKVPKLYQNKLYGHGKIKHLW